MMEKVLAVAAYAILGLIGGLVREIISHKGIIALPKYNKETGELKLGSVSALVIGAFAGFLAPYTLGVNALFSALCGYVGQDFIENAVERVLPKK